MTKTQFVWQVIGVVLCLVLLPIFFLVDFLRGD